MEERRITAEQATAIASRGKVIVSASAGSGKTFVMIERLKELVLGGEHVRDMLAVTFTNKAASQLRDRLRTALIKEIAKSEGELRKRLTAELSDLPLMDVSTIHAFCGRLVRTHFYLAGVDPTFTIMAAESPAANELSERALDEVFEEAYRADSPQLRLAFGAFYKKHRDSELRSAVCRIYKDAHRSDDLRGTLMRVGEDMFDRAAAFFHERYRAFALRALAWIDGKGAFIAEHFPAKLELLSALTAILEGVASAGDLFLMAEHVQSTPFPSPTLKAPPAKQKTEEASAVAKQFQRLRAETKVLHGELSSLLSEEEERKKSDSARELARALGTFTLAYGDAYDRLKRENNVLDYDDLERCALAVLGDEEVRREVSARYKYVCVDEYQDVNPVQERILSLVSGEEVFLVGDAKQAIYGFRGSRSEYFTEKEHTFGTALRLTSNFRSASAVLEAVNTVFAPLYEDYAPVSGGERYAGRKGAVRFYVASAADQKEEKPTAVYSVREGRKVRKASAIADIVADIVSREAGSPWYDVDAKAERGERSEKPVEYRDIAILVKTRSGDAKAIAAALAERGIPTSTADKIDLLETYECRLLLDLMRYLDNAEQDGPLVTALLALGGLSDAELAAIAATAEPCKEGEPFRKTCKRYQETRQDALAVRLGLFFRHMEELRALAQIEPVSAFADRLLESGAEALIASKEDGAVRLARLRRLLSEGDGCGSVHDFLARIGSAETFECTEEAGGNTVRILTMHSAKGLEFPVVILASLDARPSNDKDNNTYWSDEFLVAPYYYDAEAKTYSDTLVRRAASVVRMRDRVAGDRNLLYVAMTRAKYRLHLVFGATKDRKYDPEQATHLSEFIDFAACAQFFDGAEEEEKGAPLPPIAAGKAENGAREISAVFARPYPFADSVSVPAKSSATALMHAEGRPLTGGGGGKTVEEGLAYHAFLQYAAFCADAGEELKRMREEGLIPEDRLALLKEEELRKILQVPCLKRAAGKKLRREQKFLVSLPACDVMETSSRDEVLLQGAIDLLVEDEDGYFIVDYKYSSRGDEELRVAYAAQIALYRKAVAKVTGAEESKIRASIVNIAACREIPM